MIKKEKYYYKLFLQQLFHDLIGKFFNIQLCIENLKNGKFSRMDKITTELNMLLNITNNLLLYFDIYKYLYYFLLEDQFITLDLAKVEQFIILNKKHVINLSNLYIEYNWILFLILLTVDSTCIIRVIAPNKIEFCNMHFKLLESTNNLILLLREHLQYLNISIKYEALSSLTHVLTIG